METFTKNHILPQKPWSVLFNRNTIPTSGKSLESEYRSALTYGTVLFSVDDDHMIAKLSICITDAKLKFLTPLALILMQQAPVLFVMS